MKCVKEKWAQVSAKCEETIKPIAFGQIIKFVFCIISLIVIILFNHCRGIWSIFDLLLTFVILDAFLCSALYHATYYEKQVASKCEQNMRKSEDFNPYNRKALEGSSNGFAVSFSTAFTYPVGISIIILTAGIIAITITYIILVMPKSLYPI